MTTKNTDDFTMSASTTQADVSAIKPRVFTSYWGNAKKVKELGIVPIGVSRFPPRFVSGVKSFLALAPSAAMMKGLKDKSMPIEQFRDLYRKQLEVLDAQEIYDQLLELGEGKSVAILCYEKPPDTCHRHKVARWFIDALGCSVEEIPFKG